MKFVVDFEKWAFFDDEVEGHRRDDNVQACLLNELGNMCCLGFCVSQISKDLKILNWGLPSTVLKHNSDVMLAPRRKGILNKLTWLEIEASRINDDSTIPYKKKVVLLIELFANHDMNITFINLPKEV